jgi:hypothetical protein
LAGVNFCAWHSVIFAHNVALSCCRFHGHLV